MERRKKIILKFGVTLAVVLLALTFFSNTLQNINVAGVVVGFEIDGIITATHRSHGVLEYTETHTPLFSGHTGRIHFLLEDEDTVDAGDPLYEIHVTLTRNQILDQIAGLRSRHHALPRVNVSENNEEIRRLQDLLAEEDGDIITVYTEYAPFAGVVHISSFFETSNHVAEGQAVLNIAVRDGEYFVLMVYFAENFVAEPKGNVNRLTGIRVPALDYDTLDGELVDITSEGGRLLVEYHVTVPGATGGEHAEVFIEDIIIPARSESLLPNYAVREDERGDFILIVRREENTLLGYSYFAERITVEVTDRGDIYSSIILRNEPEGPVILQSDRHIMSGDRVRMVGER